MEYEGLAHNNEAAEELRDRRFALKEFTLYLIFSISACILFWVYKSYIDGNDSTTCIDAKPAVIYLAYQYLIGMIFMIVFSLGYYFLSRTNSIKKYLRNGARIVVIVMVLVYYVLMQWWYWPELTTCHLAFVFSLLGIVVLDLLFVIVVFDKIIDYFSLIR